MSPLPELPRGVTPYLVDLTISRREFEQTIMLETDEIGAAFNGEGRLVVRPRRGIPDEVGFHEHERSALAHSIVVHNHPLGGIVSIADCLTATFLNAAELRTIVPSGVVYLLQRPNEGWPTWDTMEETLMRSAFALQTEIRRRVERRLSSLKAHESNEFLYQERRKDLALVGVRLEKGSVWE